MNKQNTKQRLFEVMGKVNENFKSKLNENYIEQQPIQNSESFNIIMSKFPGHAKLVNSINSPEYNWYQSVLNFVKGNENPNEKAELIKKFQNYFLGLDYGDFNSNEELINWWLSDEQQNFIVNELNIDSPISEVKSTGVNPKYTHFAVLKRDNKIVNGWDFRGIDPEDLKLDKLYYFFNDIKDMQIEPRIVKVLTTKTLQRMGIDPFNFDNWNKDQSIFTL
jgi:hypothetical protein